MKIWKKYSITRDGLFAIFIALIIFIIISTLGWIGFPFSYFIGAGFALVVCFILDLIMNKRLKDAIEK